MIAGITVLLFLGCATVETVSQVSTPPVPEDRSSEELVTRHLAAIGGVKAIGAVRNIRINPEVTEPGFTVQGDYRATREGNMRIDIHAEGRRVFSEGIDSHGGWQQKGAGAVITDISAAGYAALSRGIEFNLLGLHDLESRGHRAEVSGRETIDGVDYYILRLRMKDGFERDFYINPVTWLIERTRETSALHPDVDSKERPTETLHSGYQRHCGVLMAAESSKIDLIDGKQLQRTQAKSIECNLDPTTLAIERHAPQPSDAAATIE